MAIIFSAVPAAYAASVGGCASPQANTFQSTGRGEDTVIAGGIFAYMFVPSSTYFAPCSPDDNLGTNASSVNMGILYAPAFLELGIIICNQTNNDKWPVSLCNGSRHFFVEANGSAPFGIDYHMWDLGYASNTTHAMQISYLSDGNWNIFIDGGSARMIVHMGGTLPSPASGVATGHYWQVETKDPGDGLGGGTAGTSANTSQQQLYFNQGWHLRTTSYPCPIVSSQHQCGQNGSAGFYGYTVN